MHTSIKPLVAALLALTLWNCRTTDPEPTPYESGVFVLNSGNFLDNNGSISFLPRDARTASTDIFNTVNSRTLTGGVQDYAEIDGKGAILVDNSTAGQDKIEIVEAGTFKSLGTIGSPDVENPRFVVQAGRNKAYVTCWGATGSGANFFANPGYVLVLNMANRTVAKRIALPRGAERIVVVGNEAYVGNAAGDRNLTIINTDTDELKTPALEVGSNTNPQAIDADGKLWAYTSGTKEMVRINTTAKIIEKRLRVGAANASRSPSSITLSQDRRTFYFVNSFFDAADNFRQKGETYRFSITDTEIQAVTPTIQRLFAGLGIDPQTNTLYAGVTPSFKQAGFVLRYRLDGSQATLIDSVRAEINPSKFFFR